MSHARGKKPSIGAFYIRRAFRIHPAYVAVLAVYFLIRGARETPAIQPFWQFATFTENLLINYSSDRAFSHVWSLCVEEHFYLIFPLLVALLMIRPSRNRTLVCFALFLLAGIGLRAYAWMHYFSAEYHSGAGVTKPAYLYFEHVYYPTFFRLDGLLAGVALAAVRCFRPGHWLAFVGRTWILATLGLVGGVLVLFLFRNRFGFWPTVLGYPLLSLTFAMFVAAFSRTGTKGIRFLVPGAGFIARISFSLYLTHKIAFHLAHEYFSAIANRGGLAALFIYVSAALLCGSVLYMGVEAPFLKLRSRLVRSAKARPAPLGVAASAALI